MRTIFAFTLVAAFVAPVFGAPTVYNYTDQGVIFKLTVEDTGPMVTASLEIKADNTGDFLKYAGLKLFNNDPPSFTDGAQTAAPDGTYSFIDGHRNGGGTGSIHGVGNGWSGSDSSGNGVAMDGSTYTFAYKWNTTVDPLVDPSIKAWTATSRGTKSRQWSSGSLRPPPPPPPPGAPEPASLVLLGIGAALVARNRMRA